jgi:hypothetical protein
MVDRTALEEGLVLVRTHPRSSKALCKRASGTTQSARLADAECSATVAEHEEAQGPRTVTLGNVTFPVGQQAGP